MRKVAIIGAGNVGAHIASAIINKNLAAEIYLIDQSQEMETAQVLDLRDSLLFSPRAWVDSADFGEVKVSDADIFIITAGAAQKPGETRIDLLNKNIKILESIAKSLGKIKSTAIIIMVANPVDILAQKATEIFDLPSGQIFGTGTLLDSSRLRWRLARKFKKNITNVHGYVLGEHGDSEFIAWSTVCDNKCISDAEKKKMEKLVREEAYKIIGGKGATYFGIGAAAAEIVDAVLSDSEKIFPVSVPLHGEYGISGIAVGVPAQICAQGISKVMELELTPEELKKLQNSAGSLKKYLDQVEGKGR